MPNKLPKGWIQTTLGEIARPSRHRALPAEFPALPYVGLEHIESQTMKLLGHGYASDVRSSSVRFFKGDVLYAKMRPYLNKVWVAEFDGLCSAEFLAFSKHEQLSSEFLALRLNAEDFVAFANGQISGERPRVDFEKLSRFVVLLPPVAEQERIVVKLNAALSKVKRAEGASKRALERLIRYRIAVLRAAVTGELTLEWRAANRSNEKDRLKTTEAVLRGLRVGGITSPSASELRKLPEGWMWVAVGQAGEVKLGRQRSPQHHSGTNMRPYLRVANVFEDRIDTSDVMQMNFTPREFEIYRLQDGDILLNEGQSLALIGRPAMYRNEVPECCFQNTLVRFRATEAIDRLYALIVFRSYLHGGQFQRIAKITTNLAHLGADRFAQLEFPLPSLEEQHEIVREVERRLPASKRLSATLEKQLVRAFETRQALLHKSFRGELVPQDQNDEPASASLDRMRVIREIEAVKPNGESMQKLQSRSKNTRRPLIDILREQKGTITPEQLFHAAAFDPSQVDEFYRELGSLRDKLVEQKPQAAEAMLWPQRAQVHLRLKHGVEE